MRMWRRDCWPVGLAAASSTTAAAALLRIVTDRLEEALSLRTRLAGWSGPDVALLRMVFALDESRCSPGSCVILQPAPLWWLLYEGRWGSGW